MLQTSKKPHVKKPIRPELSYRDLGMRSPMQLQAGDLTSFGTIKEGTRLSGPKAKKYKLDHGLTEEPRFLFTFNSGLEFSELEMPEAVRILRPLARFSVM